MTLRFALEPSSTDEILYTQAGHPTLDLRFASAKSLTDQVSGLPLIDFTRGGNGVGTYVGSDGLIKSSVVNLLVRSEEFDSNWGNNGLLAFGSGSTANATTAPDGTVTADLLTEDTGTSTHSAFQGVTIPAGSTLSVSLYVKPASGTRHIRIQLASDGAANGFRAYFDLSQFSVAVQTFGFGTGSAVSDSANIVSAGGGWYRISCAGTVDSAATSASLNFFIQSTTTGSALYTGDGTSGLYFWGAQVEQSTTVGEYVKTTSSISGAPRFDHDPETGESLGLLIEEQRANLITNSTNAAAYYTEQNSTVTANAAISPDGSTTAALLTPNTTLATHAAFNLSVTFSASTTYSYSVFVKPNGYTFFQLLLTSGFGNLTAWVNFNLTGAGSFGFTGGGELGKQIQAYPGGWYKCTLIATSGSSPFSGGPAYLVLDSDRNLRDASYAGNNTDGAYIWGAQLETGSFPTSYIPTTSATVTRNADVATITGTNFSNFYRQDEGTVFSEYISDRSTAFRYPFALSDGTIDNRFLLFSSGTSTLNARLVASGVQTNPGNRSLLPAGSNKVCLAGATGVDNAVAASNGVLSSAATPSAMPLITVLYVGASHTGLEHLNGTIRRLVYFDRRLGNDTLQAITSSTAPTTYGNLVLDSANTPQAIAGVAPTLDYRFARDRREIETVSLVDKLAFTGGDQGTFVGSDGYIQRATTNVPRFDHDPVSRVSEGLLVEESRTNLLTDSEDLSGYNKLYVTTPLDSSAINPTGSTGSYKIRANSGASSFGVRILSYATSSNNIVVSAFVKKSTHRYVYLGFGGTGNSFTALFDIEPGLTSNRLLGQGGIGTFTNIDAGYQDFPNDWIRIWAVGTTTGTDGPTLGMGPDATTFTISNWTTVGTEEIYAWGLQYEDNASFPTSYIPTTTTVTRTADSATIDGTGVLTGTYTIVEKPAGCAVESGGDIVLQEDYTVERVMVFPAALSAGQITAIREAM